MLRMFIAVDFSPEIIAKIARISEYLQTQTPSKALKWVAPENLHLTLKFMGDVREDHLDAIEQGIKEAMKGQPSFKISIEGMGMYPNASQPRVLWLGIKDTGNLSQIHHKLALALQEFYPEPEKRPFSPHLTIARIRQNGDRETIRQTGKTLSQFKADSLGTLNVRSIQLYKSDLTPQGPIYTPLLTVPLNQV